MRIGVELRHVVPQECGGIVVLLQHALSTVFERHPGVEVELYCRAASRRMFSDQFPQVVIHELPENDEGYFGDLDHLAAHRRIDVLLRSYPYDAPLRFPLDRQLVLIPDLQHERHPEFFDPKTLRIRRESFAKALSGAAALATLSEFTRQTIREHPATRTEDVFLVPPALPHTSLSSEPLSERERERLPSGPYFLFPANLWPHKNHRRTLAAFARVQGRSPEPVQLVLTGHPDGWETLKGDFAGLPVRHLGYVERPMLDALMRGATALLFFSIYEGFGIPLLEAFHAGCPVLCSNTTSLPEVGGDAVLSCDPTDIEAMADLMLKILAEPDTRTRLIACGRGRVKAYSWVKSGDELVAACRRVAAKAAPWSPEPALLESRCAQQPLIYRALRALLNPRSVAWPALRSRMRRARGALTRRG
jgi:glycosyltransferase involved in cell wall biosynthesis